MKLNFPRTHDFEALTKLASSSLAGLEKLLDDLRFLTSFAVEIRYPGITAEEQDAERCWQILGRARDLIRKGLNVGSDEEPS